MNDSDREAFYRTWSAAWEQHGKTVTPGALKMAFECLRVYSLEDIQKAVLLQAKDVEAGQFPPKPADIIRQIDGRPEDRALIAWADVEKGIRGEYSHRANYVVFDDPIVHRAVQDMGGFSRMGNTFERDVPFLRKDFLDRYMAYWRRGELDRYPNRLRTGEYLSQHNVEILLLGNTDKAQQVLTSGVDEHADTLRPALEYIQ